MTAQPLGSNRDIELPSTRSPASGRQYNPKDDPERGEKRDPHKDGEGEHEMPRQQKKWKPVTVKKFYAGGSGTQDSRQRRVEMHVREYLNRLKVKAATKQRDVIWRQFNTQQEAFDFADEHDPEGEYLKTFSQELESNGSRKFLVSSYVEFWRRYKDIPQIFRHFYEIIREGLPCHAYFDLEFSREENPEVDGEEAIEGFLSVLRIVLESMLDIILDQKWIVEFDSSSDVKFSRHVILRLPGTAFSDNAQVGFFVESIIQHAILHRSTSKSCRMMFVMNKQGKETTFIDTGVYSRNRAFRLLWSSKAGKNIPLVPTRRMLDAWSDEFPDESIFMHSLVANVDPMSRLLTCSTPDAEGRIFTYSEGPSVKRESKSSLQAGSSPYPNIDLFVIDICKKTIKDTSRAVTIRSWTSMDDNSILIFNISGYRYCGNIGREHKSNGVFFVIDRKQSIWYQKCYDPDCRGYKSPSCPLPSGIVHSPGDDKGSK